MKKLVLKLVISHLKCMCVCVFVPRINRHKLKTSGTKIRSYIFSSFISSWCSGFRLSSSTFWCWHTYFASVDTCIRENISHCAIKVGVCVCVCVLASCYFVRGLNHRYVCACVCVLYSPKTKGTLKILFPAKSAAEASQSKAEATKKLQQIGTHI